MDQRLLNPAVEVEKFSKLGTQDLQNNHPERALESFKYAFKRSRELEDDGYTERVVWIILRVPWAGYSPIGHVLYSGITTIVCKEKIFLVSREMKWRISIS